METESGLYTESTLLTHPHEKGGRGASVSHSETGLASEVSHVSPIRRQQSHSDDYRQRSSETMIHVTEQGHFTIVSQQRRDKICGSPQDPKHWLSWPRCTMPCVRGDCSLHANLPSLQTRFRDAPLSLTVTSLGPTPYFLRLSPNHPAKCTTYSKFLLYPFILGCPKVTFCARLLEPGPQGISSISLPLNSVRVGILILILSWVREIS